MYLCNAGEGERFPKPLNILGINNLSCAIGMTGKSYEEVYR